MTIKFNKYHVTDDTKIKARVFYSLDNRIDQKNAVTLYARDYGRTLQYFFNKEYENNTDLMTDYFEQGHVTLFEDHPLYSAARKRAEQNRDERLALVNKVKEQLK